MLSRVLVVLAACVGVLAVVAAPARASAQEAAAGRSLAAQIQDGGVGCSQLSAVDFEHLGDYVMQRMAGSVAAHAAMDERMGEAVGREDAERLHELIGRSFAGCGATPDSGAMSGPGMMGAAAADGGGWRAMMSAPAWAWMRDGSWQHMSGGDWRAMLGAAHRTGHHGRDAVVVVATVLGAVALVVLVALAAARGRWRRPPTAAGAG